MSIEQVFMGASIFCIICGVGIVGFGITWLICGPEMLDGEL